MNLHTGTKNVLIVDDEKYFLMSLVEGLSQYQETFATLTAENGQAAIAVLGTTSVDLVVTDLNMPELDGFGLLAHMSKHQPGVPVIVMTAYCTPEIKRKLADFGSLKILEKPLEFTELVASIHAELTVQSESYVRGITLPAFLQLLEMERKTCTLRIRSRGRVGFLCFRDGLLLEADNGGGRGDAAALDIVSWDEAEIELSGVCKIKEARIKASLGYLLMEGLRLKDERLQAENLAISGVAAAPPVQSGPDLATDADPAPEFISECSPDPGPESAPPPETTDEPPPAEAATTQSKEENVANLKELLTEFTKLQGVNAVCLVGRDGFLLDSIAKTGFDAEMIGAIASSGFGTSESMGRQLGKGAMSMSMIEFEDGPVLFSPVGADAIFVIIADKDANLGMVRMKLKKHTQDLAAAAAI
jgi:predicted regulator of Ras-like GTPase activity (Roadblock/LC7/MglB family)/FixJ family two-component response regulator